MSAAVRVALFGNSFASRVQLPALRWAGGNEVVGICGADAAKAARTAGDWAIPHSSGDWRELLELGFDLAIVATPVFLHAPMVRALLETDAAILCEKPFTLDAAEAEPLVSAAAGRLALIDHQLRWSPWRRRLGALVREGYLGTPWTARLQLLFGSAKRIAAPWSWWYDASRGGGTLGAIVSHMVDGLSVDLGRPRAVRARLATYVEERLDAEGRLHPVTADEHASLWLRTADCAEVALEANLMSPAGTGSLVEYVGSEGTLRLEGETTLLGARHGQELAPIDVEGEAPEAGDLGFTDPGIFGRVLPLYLRDVIAAVASGAGELAGAATFADGLATTRVLDAARRSAASESWQACGP